MLNSRKKTAAPPVRQIDNDKKIHLSDCVINEKGLLFQWNFGKKLFSVDGLYVDDGFIYFIHDGTNGTVLTPNKNQNEK